MKTWTICKKLHIFDFLKAYDYSDARTCDSKHSIAWSFTLAGFTWKVELKDLGKVKNLLHDAESIEAGSSSDDDESIELEKNRIQLTFSLLHTDTATSSIHVKFICYCVHEYKTPDSDCLMYQEPVFISYFNASTDFDTNFTEKLPAIESFIGCTLDIVVAEVAADKNCHKLLETRITVDNAAYLFFQSYYRNIKDLKKATGQFIADNFDEVKKSRGFRHFLKQRLFPGPLAELTPFIKNIPNVKKDINEIKSKYFWEDDIEDEEDFIADTAMSSPIYDRCSDEIKSKYFLEDDIEDKEDFIAYKEMSSPRYDRCSVL